MKKPDPIVFTGLCIFAGMVAIILIAGLITHRVLKPVEPSTNPGMSVLDKLYPFVASPNYNQRPLSTPISCIVLHATGENTKRGVLLTFLDPHSHVSAHFVVARDGSITQMVPVEMRAWHAGKSELDGTMGVNDFSIGIEMVNRDTGYEPYTTEQYHAVAKLIDQIRTVYPVPESRIVSHAEIALPPGRKCDPAGFNFQRLYACMIKYDPSVTVQMAQLTAKTPRIQKIAQVQ